MNQHNMSVIHNLSRMAKGTVLGVGLLLLAATSPLQAASTVHGSFAPGSIATGGDGRSYVNTTQYFGVFRETVTDMRVKVPGGHIRIRRSWDDGQWYINRRWSRLEPYEGSSPAVIQGASINYIASLSVITGSSGGSGGSQVLGGGVRTATSTNTVHNGNLTTVDVLYRAAERFERSSENSYTHHLLLKERILVLEDGGYRWLNRSGEWIDYTSDRRMGRFGDRHGNVFTIIYDPDNQRILGVKDKNDRQLIWYSYNANGQVTSIRDYGNRQVHYRYDGDQLSEVIQPDGATWRYSYNGNLLKTKTDPRGRILTYHYGQCSGQLSTSSLQTEASLDSRNIVSYPGYTGSGGSSTVASYLLPGSSTTQPVSATDSLIVLCGKTDQEGVGEHYKYEYDKTKREYYKQVKTGSGKVSEYWYDREGDLIRKDLNGVTVLKIEKNGRVETHIDATGNRTIKTFNEWDDVTKTEYPDGSVKTTTYSAQYDQPTGEADEEGRVTKYQLDDAGRITLITEAKGSSVQRQTGYAYDEAGNLTTLTRYGSDPNSTNDDIVTSYQYDDNGNRTQVTDPAGKITSYTHDGGGFVTSMTDPLNRTTTYTKDGKGRTLSRTNPLDQTTHYQYNDAGDLLKTIDALSQSNEHSYDIRGNRISAKDALNHATLFSYDVDDRLISTKDPVEAITSQNYDTDGRPTKTIDAHGNEIQIGYLPPTQSSTSTSNGARLPGTITYPTYSKSLEYDNRNRIIKTTDHLNDNETHVTETIYDKVGNRTRTTDAEGRVTKYQYDALNRLIQITDPLNQTTGFQYDNRDNLTHVTDPNGHTTQYTYDNNDRKTSEIRPMGQTIQYLYDDAGQLIQITDPAGRITKNQYDDAGRLQQQEHFTPNTTTVERTVTYTYDAVGNLKTYVSGTLSASYLYDKNNRLIQETTNYGPFSLSHSYSYDAAGNKASYTGPDGITVTYVREKGRLSRINLPGEGGGDLYYNSYLWTAPTKISFPGNGKRIYDYDALLRPIQIKGLDPGQNAQLDYQYSYDKTGNITQRSTKAINELERKAHIYKYDALQRLIEAAAPDEMEGWAYDANGNRLSDALSPGIWEYDDNDRLLGSPKGNYQYDTSGSPTQKVKDSETFIYSYNAENRLEKVADQNDQLIGEYTYDPVGRRIKKATPTETTYFHYTDEGLAGEYNQHGTLIRQYGYAPDSTWTTDPLYQKTVQGYAYYLNDHLGTPQQLILRNGAVVWKASYRVFGELKQEHKQTGWDNLLRFPGQYYDKETGTHYNYFRIYDLRSGRYTKKDPIGLGNGPNPYVYSNSNPVNNWDSNGLVTMPLVTLPSRTKRAFDPTTTGMVGHYVSGMGKKLNLSGRACEQYLSDHIIGLILKGIERQIEESTQSYAGALESGQSVDLKDKMTLNTYVTSIYAFGGGYDDFEYDCIVTGMPGCCAVADCTITVGRIDDFKDPIDLYEDKGWGGSPWSPLANPLGVPYEFEISCDYPFSTYKCK